MNYLVFLRFFKGGGALGVCQLQILSQFMIQKQNSLKEGTIFFFLLVLHAFFRNHFQITDDVFFKAIDWKSSVSFLLSLYIVLKFNNIWKLSFIRYNILTFHRFLLYDIGKKMTQKILLGQSDCSLLPFFRFCTLEGFFEEILAVLDTSMLKFLNLSKRFKLWSWNYSFLLLNHSLINVTTVRQ